MDKKSPETKNACEEHLHGVVTARNCDCCGHHEIGIATETGEYIALKPGMRVIVIRGNID